MATLYIRNVPADLYERFKRRAEKAGRSVNAEILEVLERDDLRYARNGDFERKFAALKGKYPPIDVDATALIREDRDLGHKPEFGY